MKNWLVPFGEEQQAQPAGTFVLDGKASLRAIVGRVAEESEADGIGLVAVLEDDGRSFNENDSYGG